MKYNISRHIIIDADLKKVRSYVEDFKQWKLWSPWSIIEPDHQSEIQGEAGKEGHSMSWSGKMLGDGKMTLEKADDHSIYYHLEFFKPFKSKSKTAFKFKKASEGKTKVIWTMDSSLPFFLFFMLKMMKSWLEMDYDRGLSMLKEVVEKGRVNAKTTNEGVVDFEGFSYVGIQKTSHIQKMPADMEHAFQKLMNDLEKKGAKAEKWLSIYPKVDIKNKMFTYIAAISDEGLKEKKMGEDDVTGKINSGKMLKIRHKGSYRFLGNAWSMGMMYLRTKKMKQGGYPFEFYVNNPQNTKEEDLITEIYFPLK